MTDLHSVRTPSSGRRMIIPGVVLAVLGVAGIVTYVVLASTETPGDGSGQGGLQGGVIVISALLVGVGVVLLLTGLLRRRRRNAGMGSNGDGEPRSMRGNVN